MYIGYDFNDQPCFMFSPCSMLIRPNQMVKADTKDTGEITVMVLVELVVMTSLKMVSLARMGKFSSAYFRYSRFHKIQDSESNHTFLIINSDEFVTGKC